MRTLAFVVALAAGCSGDAPNGGAPDASNVCTKAVYDPCATEHDCTSGNCRTFTDVGSGLEVCTEPCSATMPCPNDSTGAAGTCDSTLMLCRPAMANACTPSLAGP